MASPRAAAGLEMLSDQLLTQELSKEIHQEQGKARWGPALGMVNAQRAKALRVI